MASDGVFWVPHPEAVWLPGRHKSGNTYTTDLGDVTVRLSDRGQEVTDQEELSGVADCCTLTQVSPATILHTVRVRYGRGEIYTNVSNVLIATNPFQALSIYSQEYIDQYRNCEDLTSQPPHIFGLCAQAFACLMDTNDLATTSSQAVLISGESGAGKTETTKLVLYYTSEMLAGQAGGIEDILMEINPILEAFGNAKTVRNNNSSRFGKWIEVRLDPASRSLEGVQVVDYLLEVTRVTGQGPGERNYHIFYQLAADESTRADFKFADAGRSTYLAANAMHIEGVDDARELQDLRKALTALEFSTDEERGVFTSVAATVHIGNIDFIEGGDTKVSTPDALSTAAELLGVDAQDLSKCVCFKRITTGKDVLMSPLDNQKAKLARDSLAKVIYSLLFKWLVLRCNQALGKNVGGSGDGGGQFLGVLDIAGFESFETNLLEQLLINLSNEKLQNFFNNLVFTRELEEYKAEDIDIANITFADNSDVLALIEGPGGLLAMLDDATNGVKQTDELFTQKVLKEKVGNPRFLKPKKFDPVVFGIKHYAGDVFYKTNGFLEKNAQNQPPEVLELLAGSTVEVVRDIVQDTVDRKESKAPTAATRKRATVGSSFKKSLTELVEKLRTANCHFVRCIKPNKDKLPDKISSPMVMDQLRLCGVMETVEIRKAGFLVRHPCAEFIGRYVTMVPKENRKKVQELLCAAASGKVPEVGEQLRVVAAEILKLVGAEEGQFALGKTKVFLKAPVFQTLEDKRRAAFEPFAVMIQAAWRGYNTREIMREVRETHHVITQCIKDAGHELWAESFLAKSVHRATLVETSLKRFDLALMQAVSLPIKLGYLHEASKVRANMAAESIVARKLANLALQNNIFEMEGTLAQAELYKLEGPLVDNIKKRLEDARAEGALKHSLQAALDADELDDLRNSVQDATGKGYHEVKRWLQPSGAAVMEKAIARLKLREEEHAHRNAILDSLSQSVESHLACLDEQAVQEVLARASNAGLTGETVDRLARHCTDLARQSELHRDIAQALASGDRAALQAAVNRIEENGIGNDSGGVLPKLAQDLDEARRLLLEQNANGKVILGTGVQNRCMLTQVKAALERCGDIDELVALQGRLAEHLAKEADGCGCDGEDRLAEERAAEAQLGHHIERVKEEIALIEEMQITVKVDDAKRTRLEELCKKCEAGKWAKGSEYWIRKDGWTVWEHCKDKRDKLLKSDVALLRLRAATDAYDVEEMEAAYITCCELGLPPSELEEYNKAFTQLQRPHAVRDLLSRWRGDDVRCTNLEKQLEYLQAKEAGMESMIVLQLTRLTNSQSVETMRACLRKADRAEIRDPMVDEIRNRADEIERQEPFVQLLRDATWSRNLEKIRQAVHDLETSEAGLANSENWKCNDLARVYDNAKKCLEELVQAQTDLEEHEQELLVRLEAMKTCMDAEEIDDALEQASARHANGELVSLLMTRRETLRKQRKLIDAMRKCIYSQDGGKDLVQDLLEQVIAEGLDGSDHWLLEDGPRTFEQLKSYVQEVEAEAAKKADKDTEIRRQLRELVHSTDVHAIKDVLARATIFKVKTELTQTLESRVEALELQTRHIKDLRKILVETDAILLGEAIANVRKDHLDNPSKWDLPEGAKLLSKVIARKVHCERLEDLEISIRRAVRIYDVPILQNCFREVEELGVPPDHFKEARQLLLSLHDGDNITKLIAELKELLHHSEADDLRASQGIKNLVDQQRHLGLTPDHQALRDISSVISRGRARTRAKSWYVAPADSVEEDVTRSIFQDLRNLKCLRDPLTWSTEAANGNIEALGRAMVEFQADRMTCSLTQLNACQENMAVQNFQDILRCMGDRPCAFIGSKEEPILRRLSISRRICNESYVQVMKQLTNNPSSESREKGWRLLRRMVKLVLPSAELYDFVLAFVQREAEPAPKVDPAKQAEKKDFRRLMVKAARKQQEENDVTNGDGQLTFAAVARVAARKYMESHEESAASRLNSAGGESTMRPTSTAGGDGAMRPSRSCRSRRGTLRRKSLAAALEEREREEERMERCRSRNDMQIALAQEILRTLLPP